MLLPKILLIVILNVWLTSGQQQLVQQTGALTQTIYQFLKQSQLTSKFAELLDRTAQQSNDKSVIDALSNPGQNNNNNNGNTGGMYTVFVPSNDAFNQLPADIDQLRNDINNLIVKEYLTLERIKQMNGRNLSRTFGYMPRLTLRVVPNHYSRQLAQKQPGRINKRQIMPTTTQNSFYGQQSNQNLYGQSTTPYYGQPTTPSSFYGQQSTASSFYGQQPAYFGQPTTKYYGPPTPPGMVNPTMNPMYGGNPMYASGGMNSTQSDLSIYDQYNTMYGSISSLQPYDGPNISPKLPQDELYLLNSAIVLDKFDLTNGVVYLINAYPRYFDKSLYALLRDNSFNGLAQNLNFWMSRAEQSYRQGDETLRNALNAFGSNTYFLPTDQAFNKYTFRDRLNNNSFLVDVLLRSHRVNEQIIFDHYLDSSVQNYYTDTRLPVSTRHRRINNIDDIEISIGHVKGKILPDFRNIYCASGVIHLVDTVLGVPSRSAYQELATIPELSTFRALVDRSAKYRQLLDQQISPRSKRDSFRNKRQYPINNSMQQNNNMNNLNNNNNFNQQNYNQPSYNSLGVNGGVNTQMYTILAPSDSALLTVKDDLMKNDSLIEQILSAHIVTDSSNRIFYTDHDDSLFANGQSYMTLLPGNSLTANVQPDSSGVSNNVVLSLQSNQQVSASIINGNARVSNGVIHVVDALLFPYASSDITAILDKYSNMNSAESPAFSQFVDALRSTGIFNDLKQPAKKYTLFIPTNEALARYQDIINGNDIERKKNLIYRHLCLDQNLQSATIPQGNGSMLPYNNMNNMNNLNNLNNQPNNMNNMNNQPNNLNNPNINNPNMNNPNMNNPNLNNPNMNNLNNPNNLNNQNNFNNQNNPNNFNNLNNQNTQRPVNQNNNYPNQNMNNNNMMNNNNNQLICRNALGQDVTLTKDTYGLVTGQGFAHSKVLTKFPGIYSSAYLLERPLYNSNLNNVQTQARVHYNSASNLQTNFFLICLIFISFYAI